MSLSLSSKADIAVIDSGVGGLSVLAELRQVLPHSSIIYYADSANCPYGDKSREEIESLTMDVVKRVVAMGATIVVVACNTMTAVAIEKLRKRWSDIDFVGMEPAVKPALLSSKTGVVGVLATTATFGGELYQHTKDEYIEGKKVVEVAGKGLVEFVESGRHSTKECEELLAEYIKKMLVMGADKIVLGCTHYPFLTNQIERVIAKYEKCKGGELGVEIINPAGAVSRRVVQIVQKRGLLIDLPYMGEIYYFSSGTDKQREFVAQFLNNNL